MWLWVPSPLIPGLRQHALFLLGICYAEAYIRSWAFWGDPLARPAWIGPRHTNFPDGSICAYEPSDGTWGFGEPLIALIDLYSVWAVRHLHLLIFGRWPGPQAVHLPYERLLEISPEEHCGCGQDRRYADCCRPRDLARDRIVDAVDFLFWSRGTLRSPPQAVMDFAMTPCGVERLNEIL